MTARQRIVLGTRGSDLARAQTAMVEAALRAQSPELDIAVEIITTRGDETSRHAGEPVDRRAGRKGMFTAEIERALLDRRIDVAVHSAKDLPSEPTAGLEICAALPRAAVDDILITKVAATVASLPPGATIATGSVRRQYQLRCVRPDIHIVDLRGNVPTRLRKLVANPWDGIILARAGLERLGLEPSREEFAFDGRTLQCQLLPHDQFLPAGGQGIIALQVRAADAATRECLANLNDAEASACLRAEREFLRILQGDCGTPVGVFATVSDGTMTVRAQVFTAAETAPRVAELRETIVDHTPEWIGAKLMELMNGG